MFNTKYEVLRTVLLLTKQQVCVWVNFEGTWQNQKLENKQRAITIKLLARFCEFLVLRIYAMRATCSREKEGGVGHIYLMSVYKIKPDQLPTIYV